MGSRWVWFPLLVMATMMLTVTPAYSNGVIFSTFDSVANQPVTFSDKGTPSRIDFVHVAQSMSSALAPSSCQPGVENQYPESVNPGQEIMINTTVTSACVSLFDEVIVNILLPNSSVILSTAPASPAVNTVRAPARGGPWSLIVQVLWNDPPTGGTFEIFQTTIIININH